MTDVRESGLGAESTALTALLVPLWECIEAELGFRKTIVVESRSVEADVRDRTVRLRFGVQRPDRYRKAQFYHDSIVLSIPSDVLVAGADAVVAHLRRRYTLQCLRCGIHHLLGTERCNGAQCYASVAWRAEAPRPTFYVEPGAPFDRVIRLGEISGRRQRFVYAIEEHRLLCAEYTLRSGRWAPMVPEKVQELKSWLMMELVPCLTASFASQSIGGVQPSRFAFDRPGWCLDVSASD